jgi:hypothetical protein
LDVLHVAGRTLRFQISVDGIFDGDTWDASHEITSAVADAAQALKQLLGQKLEDGLANIVGLPRLGMRTRGAAQRFALPHLFAETEAREVERSGWRHRDE